MGRLSDMRRKRDEEARRRRNASGTASTPLTDPTSPLYMGYSSSYTSYDSGSNCDSGSSSSYDSGSSSSSDCGGGSYGE